MKLRNLTAALLAILTLSQISCGSSGTEAADTEAQTPDTTAVPTETVDPLPDNLPEKDFGGRDFIVSMDNQFNADFIYVEELNGEGVNDSVFARNLALQERFNANVKTDVSGDYTVTFSNILKAVQAGDS